MWIITGGGTGIGRALANALASREESVLVIGRREPLLQETAKQSPLIEYLAADLSTKEGLHVIAESLKEKGPLKGLVNNAGTLDPIAPMSDIKYEAWHQAFHTNVDAALFLPQMLMNQLKDGRVLNIGSGAAYFPIQGWTAYCVTKAALAMLTRCWQVEDTTIAFSSATPGIADTDMQAIARKGAHMDPEHVEFYLRLKRDGRLIEPETVAAFLSWLLLETDAQNFSSKEWDIYDKSHHEYWLKSPHQVLHWDY